MLFLLLNTHETSNSGLLIALGFVSVIEWILQDKSSLRSRITADALKLRGKRDLFHLDLGISF